MTTPVLATAIDSASAPRLRSTLKRICELSFIARDLVSAQLLAEDATDDEAPASTSASASTSTPPHAHQTPTPSPVKTPASLLSRKRHFPRYARCEQCRDEFDLTDNRPGDCVYHDGVCGADMDRVSVRDLQAAFLQTGGDEADWFEVLEKHNADQDEHEGRISWHLWACCGRPSDDEGCKVDVHRAPAENAKKRSKC